MPLEKRDTRLSKVSCSRPLPVFMKCSSKTGGYVCQTERSFSPGPAAQSKSWKPFVFSSGPRKEKHPLPRKENRHRK
ncbi:hypothetical protein CDAR_417081 [Caerostris darwini]|uniref:Uncharacterized protein n=1 Tax=Caerostris darwini TaxID=1538125 RepID=A0AAV4X6W5_9ARAC|nr:hypothetical protein CDAR_417081 [Caerostris darwini]